MTLKEYFDSVNGTGVPILTFSQILMRRFYLLKMSQGTVV